MMLLQVRAEQRALLDARSATWPKEVKKIASQFVTNNTVHVFVGSVSDKLVANKSITQKVKVRWIEDSKWNPNDTAGNIMQCACMAACTAVQQDIITIAYSLVLRVGTHWSTDPCAIALFRTQIVHLRKCSWAVKQLAF